LTKSCAQQPKAYIFVKYDANLEKLERRAAAVFLAVLHAKPKARANHQGKTQNLKGKWYHLPGSNGGPLDPQSSALTN
jgi:hypothetical protein